MERENGQQIGRGWDGWWTMGCRGFVNENGGRYQEGKGVSEGIVVERVTEGGDWEEGDRNRQSEGRQL